MAVNDFWCKATIFYWIYPLPREMSSYEATNTFTLSLGPKSSYYKLAQVEAGPRQKMRKTKVHEKYEWQNLAEALPRARWRQ